MSPNKCLPVNQLADIAPLHLLTVVPPTGFVFLPFPLTVCLPPPSCSLAPGSCLPPLSKVAKGEEVLKSFPEKSGYLYCLVWLLLCS